jgi:plasmid maintenance system killer protein
VVHIWHEQQPPFAEPAHYRINSRGSAPWRDIDQRVAARQTSSHLRGLKAAYRTARLAGKHSIRFNDQWRVVFRWTDAGPEDEEVIDHH